MIECFLESRLFLKLKHESQAASLTNIIVLHENGKIECRICFENLHNHLFVVEWP